MSLALSILGFSLAQASALAVAFLTGFLISLPDGGAGGALAWRAGAFYALHPVTIVSAILSPTASWADSVGDACLAAAALGARAGAPVGAFGAWCVFFLASPVQAVCISVPLFAALLKVRFKSFNGLDALLVAGAAIAASNLCGNCGGSGSLAVPSSSHEPSSSSCVSSFRSRYAIAAIAPGFLGPDPGLYWYLFASVFLRALPYFTLLVWTAPALLVAPALLRLGVGEPAFLVAAGGAAIFDASNGGGGVRRLLLIAAIATNAKGPISLAPSRLRTLTTAPFITDRISPARAAAAGGLAHFAAAAAPAMKHLWLRVGGTGNANFALNMQLLGAVAAAMLLADFARAGVADVDQEEEEEEEEEEVKPRARA